jgi:hypothetical protein
MKEGFNMSQRFKKEVRSIEAILKGSRWALEPETQDVINEYKRIIDSNNVKSREKRVALQIMFSSRAIDTFLANICRWDCAKRGRTAKPYYTLESSLKYLNDTGLHTGNKLPLGSYKDLCDNVKNKRNRYLHKAGVFPTDIELTRFLSSTLNGMREVSKLGK